MSDHLASDDKLESLIISSTFFYRSSKSYLSKFGIKSLTVYSTSVIESWSYYRFYFSKSSILFNS